MTTHDLILVIVNSCMFYLKDIHKPELLEPRQKETVSRNCVEVNGLVLYQSDLHDLPALHQHSLFDLINLWTFFNSLTVCMSACAKLEWMTVFTLISHQQNMTQNTLVSDNIYIYIKSCVGLVSYSIRWGMQRGASELQYTVRHAEAS